MWILNRSALSYMVDDSDSQSENKPMRRSPNEPEETKINPVTLCAHGSYKASFEACFVDLGCLEKHTFSKVLLETAETITAQCGSPSILIRLLHLGSFPDWLSLSHGSVERFQSRSICSYDETDCYYK